jgi:hypothetical protein
MATLRYDLRRRRRSPVAASLLCVALASVACGGEVASPSPGPTEPAATPAATPATLPAGPLAGVGPIGQATYGTPAGFVPAFAFDIRADGWRSIVEPSELGFDLATPNAARIKALIGLAKPVADSIDTFSGELGVNGLLDGSEVVEDIEVDGFRARTILLARSDPSDAFRIRGPDGEVTVGIGEPLPENLFVFVEHPDGPFVLLLSLASGADVERRFVFDALIGSIAFH